MKNLQMITDTLTSVLSQCNNWNDVVKFYRFKAIERSNDSITFKYSQCDAIFTVYNNIENKFTFSVK